MLRIGLLSLMAVVVTIQSAPVNAVGTPEACAQAGGKWRVNSNWTENCVIEAPQDECLKNWGGATSSERNVCVLPMTTEESIARCAARGGNWGRHGARVPYCYFAAQEQECRTKGGYWQRLGRLQIFGCIQRSTDAGKPCQDGSECQFRTCLYKGSDVPYGTPARGVCQDANNSFGCYVPIKDGKTLGRLCVD